MLHTRACCRAAPGVLILLASLALESPPLGAQGGNPGVASIASMADHGAETKKAGLLLQRRAMINVQGATLSDALHRLNDVSGVQVAFSPSETSKIRKLVHCECQELTVGAALDRMLEGTHLDYMVHQGQVVVHLASNRRSRPLDLPPSLAINRSQTSSFLGRAPLQSDLLAHLTAESQEHTVTGTVTSSELQPLAGVLVSVEGTSTGTITNATGTYRITAPGPTSNLVFSQLGYASQTLPIDGRPSIDVQLQVTALSVAEIVVVGYGTQRRADMTGAVSSVSTEQLERTPTVNVVQALQGATPGLDVTMQGAGAEARMSMNIRGQSSLLASSSPLIVVDGIPYNGPLSEINQNDIGSISVLRDASATSIYGARGANGVILIETRMGTGEAQFSYSGYIGAQSPNFDDLRMMTGPQFAEFKCTYLNDGVRPADCASFLSTTERENLAAGISTDWIGAGTRPGRQYDQNLSVMGGTGGTRYYLNGAVMNVRGVAQNDDFARYSLRVNLDQEVSSWLRASTSTQFGWTERTGLGTRWGSTEGGYQGVKDGAMLMNPLVVPFDEYGNQVLYPWPEEPFLWNPLHELTGTGSDVTQRVFTSNHLEAQLPGTGLRYRLTGGADLNQRSSATYLGRQSGAGYEREGHGNTSDRTVRELTLENLLAYAYSTDRHQLDLTGLLSFAHTRNQARNIEVQGTPGDVLTYWQADVAKTILPSYEYFEEGLISQMGRVFYGYDSRYMATFTVRRDGSSVFGDNHKYGIFPSVALAWNLHNESFLPLPDAVTELKLRTSWGRNGNAAIRPYQTLATLKPDRTYIQNGATWPGYLPESIANPDLKWETTETVNVGLDFALFDYRVSGTLDLYTADTRDLLINRNIASTHGFTRATEYGGNHGNTRITSNLGKVRNRGVEVGLSTENIRGDRFQWSTLLNVGVNRNQILDLYGDGNDDLTNNWIIGEPIGVLYGIDIDGIWQAGDDIANSATPNARPGDIRYRDANGDGKIDPDDRVVRSTRQPAWRGGMTNTFRYGGLSLSSVLYTVQGLKVVNEFMNPYRATSGVVTEIRHNTSYREWWTEENPSRRLPAARPNIGAHGTAFLDDASFVRLRDVTLAFELPGSITRSLGTSRFQIYASGRNLFTWTRWEGLDPEIPDQQTIPIERTFVAGMNVNF